MDHTYSPLNHDPLAQIEQVSHTLWTLAAVAASSTADDHTLPKALGGLAVLLGNVLSRACNVLWEERERCTCGQRTVREG